LKPLRKQALGLGLLAILLLPGSWLLIHFQLAADILVAQLDAVLLGSLAISVTALDLNRKAKELCPENGWERMEERCATAQQSSWSADIADELVAAAFRQPGAESGLAADPIPVASPRQAPLLPAPK
jgi:hypothetical protein